MKVFVTGSTGYIGSAVVSAMVKAGHRVTGLVFSPEKEEFLRSLGAFPHKGSLTDPHEWEEMAAQHESIIHTGMVKTSDPAHADLRAVEAMLSAAQLKGFTRSFIYTSGVWVLGDTGGKSVDESGATTHPAEMVAWRPAVEEVVLSTRADKLAASVIRPGLVYGGKAGILAMLFSSAVQEGAARYVGDGKNHWPLIHREDLAQLYRTVAEKAAKGIFHGVDNQPLTVAEVAKAASLAAGKMGSTQSQPLEESRKQMGLFADALALEQDVVTKRSIELGWAPIHPSFQKSAAAAFQEWRS